MSDHRGPTDRSERFGVFLESLDGELSALSRRLDEVRTNPTDARPPIDSRSNASAGAPNEILIGLGQPEAGKQPEDWICLNNKATTPNLPSMTAFVLAASEETVEQWRAVADKAGTGAPILEHFSLVVEDASPDSILAFIWFLARLDGLEPDQLSRRWSTYVQRWEAGYVQSMGAPYQSFGALVSALVHRSLGSDWGQAWRDGLRFTVDALRSNVPPEDLSTMPSSPELEDARAFMRYEERAYEDRLSHSTCVQLRMPMTGARDRFQLVDACFSEEAQPLGAFKVFLRTDQRHPFLKNGFAVMVLYKSDPAVAGSGNDLTASVSKELGIDLRDLWYALEEREREAWGDVRPCDQPRPNILGYPDAKTAEGGPAPNEPWYDGQDWTLIAAPKRLKDGRLGSKLDWGDLCETVWSLYQPFRDILVRPGADAAIRRGTFPDDQLVPLDECPDHPIAVDQVLTGNTARPRRRLVVAGWPAPGQGMDPLRPTPTLGRYLTAYLERNTPGQDGIRLAELPQDDAYDIVKFGGGLGIVSEMGCYLLDAGRHHSLRVHDLVSEFENVCMVLGLANSASERIGKLLADIDSYVSGRRRSSRELELLGRLADLQLDIRKVRLETIKVGVHPDRQRFRAALMKRWGITGRLDELYEGVGQVRSLLQSHSELHANRRIAFLTIYGFPLVLVAAFFGFVFQGLPAHDVPQWSQVHWVGVALYVLIAALGVAILRLAGFLWDRSSRFTKPEDRAKR